MANLAFKLGTDADHSEGLWDLQKLRSILVAASDKNSVTDYISSLFADIAAMETKDAPQIVIFGSERIGVPANCDTTVVPKKSQKKVMEHWYKEELEQRYRIMAKAGIRNLDRFIGCKEELDQKHRTLAKTVIKNLERFIWHADIKQPSPEDDDERQPRKPVIFILPEVGSLVGKTGTTLKKFIQKVAWIGRGASMFMIVGTSQPEKLPHWVAPCLTARVMLDAKALHCYPALDVLSAPPTEEEIVFFNVDQIHRLRRNKYGDIRANDPVEPGSS